MYPRTLDFKGLKLEIENSPLETKTLDLAAETRQRQDVLIL